MRNRWARMRCTARLALLAALLIALAPAVSRVLGSRGGGMLAGWLELCTPAGLTWVDAATGAPREKAPASGWPGGAGDACPQCPLAATMPPPEGLRWPSPPRRPVTHRAPEASARPPAVALAGPGCRGPPAA